VKHGDSLSGIAFWAYGNAGAWKCIWEANPWIGNPNRIQAGWDIYLPPDCSGHKGGGGDDYDHPKAGGGDDYDHPKAGGGGDDYDHPKAGGGGDDYDHPKGGGGYGGYHIVRHGETLWGIACSYYSDCGYWRIYNANRHLIAYPGHIQVGWKLYIP
jgi:nucleoid-associated protein YgaU